MASQVIAAKLVILTAERWEEFELPDTWSLKTVHIEAGKAYIVIMGPVPS